MSLSLKPISAERRVAGLDLGRFSDQSVLVLLDCTMGGLEVHSVNTLPSTSWQNQTSMIRDLCVGVKTMAADRTGIGQPVVEQLERELRGKTKVLPVNFSAKTKRQLIERLIAAVGTKRLSIRPGCRGADVLREQMSRFTMTPGQKGPKYSGKAAGRDDAVIALALAVAAASSRTNSVQ